MKIKVKRVYEPASRRDGCRVLVDRFWPRGTKKADVKIDLWLKGIAPSDELRQWFGHDPDKWHVFCQRYHAELAERPTVVEELIEASDGRTLTLVYAAKDERHNHAAALKEFLDGYLRGKLRKRA